MKKVDKDSGIQTDIFGNPVHILNAEKIFRMVRCGRCKQTFKSSQTRTHLSFGKALTLCKGCIKELETAGIIK